MIIIVFLLILCIGGVLSNCHSKYGAFESGEIIEKVQLYAKEHIQKSFRFLLMVNIYYLYNIVYYNFLKENVINYDIFLVCTYL